MVPQEIDAWEIGGTEAKQTGSSDMRAQAVVANLLTDSHSAILSAPYYVRFSNETDLVFILTNVFLVNCECSELGTQ